MNDEQAKALAALHSAHLIYRQADMHRIEMLWLCKALGIPKAATNRALELKR